MSGGEDGNGSTVEEEEREGGGRIVFPGVGQRPMTGLLLRGLWEDGHQGQITIELDHGEDTQAKSLFAAGRGISARATVGANVFVPARHV